MVQDMDVHSIIVSTFYLFENFTIKQEREEKKPKASRSHCLIEM